MTTPRSELALAAIATAAIPGMDVISVRAPEHAGAECDVAQVSDSDGNHWIVRAPRTDAAGANLAAERGVLHALARLRDTAAITFNVPRPTGFAALPDGGEAMIYPRIAGRGLHLESLARNLGLAQDVARAIASLHHVSPEVFERAGLPVYDAATYRRRKSSEIEEAARTGHVPIPLLRRWRTALAFDELWEFKTTPTHGDLAPEHVLVRGGVVTGLLDWSHAQVADPADDLAWLLAGAPEEALETIIDAYTDQRDGHADGYVVDRAILASELEVMRWLMYGVRARSNEIIDDAIEMLTQLAEAVRHEPDIGASHEPDSEAVAAEEPPVAAESSASDATEILPLHTDDQGNPVPWQSAEAASEETDENSTLTAPLTLNDPQR